MKIFLQEIIKNIKAQYGSELHNLSLVFPNKRPGVFAAKYLAELIDKPHWMPRIYTVNELMINCSEYKMADNILLISRLYNIFKELTGTTESFDQFYFWGELLLADFNDLDKYLVNAEDLFRNLSSVKEIENNFEFLEPEQLEAIEHFWSNFNSGQLTSQKQNFIKIWSKLFSVYTKFKQELKKEGIAYEGMIYREIAESITNQKHIENLPLKMIFIGFNALNKCEEKFLEYLQNQKKAEFYWDYDNLYLNNKVHEAGRFLRHNISKFKASKLDIDFDILEKGKKLVNVISVPSEIAQVKACYDILNKIPESEYSQTAIVLANEQLLLPLLYSIPKKIKDINVTMGYPLKDTPVFSLISNIIELQKSSKPGKTEPRFYYKLVLGIINHQYISYSKDIVDISNNIHKYNKIYLRQSEITKNELLSLIFRQIDDPKEIGEYLLNILYQLNKQVTGEDENNIEQEYIYSLYKAINRLNEILNSLPQEFSIDMYLRLLSQYIQGISASFEGEPLLGLQIMGLLETRVLDFKNIIFLSVNEGILPNVTTAPSFIPYNIRKGFNMQTIEFQDSIFAYTFYRLLQRSQNIHLIYSNVSSGLTIGEKSRYISQMIYSDKFDVKEISQSFDIDIDIANFISIDKDSRIQDILKNYYTGGDRKLSPSAINSYLNCPLQFYYRYIAGIKEADEISEEVDGMIFGNLYHKSMFSLYSDFEGKLLNTSDIEKIIEDKSKIEKTIENAFREDYFNISDKSSPVEIKGKNVLIFDILRKYIIKTLQNDLNYCPFTIEALEKEYQAQINIATANKSINIYGKIDRIDSKEGRVRIIDYKTGDANLIYKGVEQLFSADSKERNSAVMQTFLYSHMYSSANTDKNLKIEPCIFQLKDIFKDSFAYNIKEAIATRKYNTIDDFAAIENTYTENLSNIISSIFNIQLPFSQTEDIKTCEYCAYVGICGR